MMAAASNEICSNENRKAEYLQHVQQPVVTSALMLIVLVSFDVLHQKAIHPPLDNQMIRSLICEAKTKRRQQ